VAEKDYKLKRFGKYLILDHIVDGGMAQIFRARYLGEEADKIVAIKMIREQFSKDDAFKKMFMGEIKVTFDLLHPNIIQTYDYGVVEDHLYVAMEYCEGKNLQEYLKKLREKNVVFPIDIAVYITTQICRALNYAHTKVDKLTGKEAKIVHRDISPHNVMLSYDGAVKVIDFGIAKAETSADSTRAGTIKGKLSYLAPEYLEGLKLDARYDEFATGITLWEMLCNRKLFKAENDLAVLKQIQECKIPAPSSINNKVSKELDEIVLKSLSKDRNNRYENCDFMDRALTRFLFKNFPEFNPSDLNYFSNQLFSEDITENRKKLFEFGKIDIAPYLKELKEGKPALPKTEDQKKEVSIGNEEDLPKIKKEQVLDFGFTDEKTKRFSFKTTKKTDAPSVKKKEQVVRESGNELVFKEGTKTNQLTSGDLKVEKPTLRSSLTLAQKEELRDRGVSEATLNGENQVPDALEIKKVPKKSTKKILLYASVLVGVIYFGYNKFKSTIDDNVDEALGIKKEVKEKKRSIASKSEKTEKIIKGELVLTNFDQGKHQVLVDGEPKSVDVFGGIEVQKGKDLTLRVEILGREHFVKKINIPLEQRRLKIEIPETPLAKFAYLKMTSACAEGEINFQMFGENRTEKIPIKVSPGIAFPLKLNEDGEAAPISFELFFKSSGRSVKRKINIDFQKENDMVDFCQVLYEK
jgi:eukaryotic-like serine/threonine-protein kinase